ncbi:coiled-coil domain-containing protein 81-like isoform X1 [Anser cygnoides]|uniref:coiled-coil domain-containing protein 81-like isoform X1 n=1 Tax=Anser cygnoides TaxID=8845 RepID=UPI0034D1A0C0
MAKYLFSAPCFPPTIEKLLNSELAKIWASASYYLSQQLALHQAVRIPGLGTFTVVTEQVASQKNDIVTVERPMFHLAKAIVHNYDLRYDYIDIPGHLHFEELPYAQIASENNVSESLVRLCIDRTTRLFCVCIEDRQNVAFLWRDVGMLIIEGKDVKMKFYEDFLKKLNGTTNALQALLRMPEMNNSVISHLDTAASQTASERVIVFPMYKHESMLKKPTGTVSLRGQVKPSKDQRAVSLIGQVKPSKEQGWTKGGESVKKEDLPKKRLLHRATLAPERLPALTVKPESSQKAEQTERRARKLPAIQRSSVKEKEEEEKVIPQVTPRMVDFIAKAIEQRKENKCLKIKETLPKHIQNFLAEEENKNKELQEEKKKQPKQRSAALTKAKVKREVEMPTTEESCPSEERSPERTPSSLSESDSGQSSPDLMERMMGEWDEDGEEPPRTQQDSPVPPKRSLSPRTHGTLREVVTCIVEQVARKQRGERDAERDLQEQLKCELAVLRWSRSAKEEQSYHQLWQVGHQPAPPAGPRQRESRRVRRVVPMPVSKGPERPSGTQKGPDGDIQQGPSLQHEWDQGCPSRLLTPTPPSIQ